MSNAMQSMPKEIQAMVEHHAHLTADLQQRVGALRAAVANNKPFTEERDSVHNFAVTELVPHALAEEDVIYLAGAGVATMKPLVDGMLMEHETIVGLVPQISAADDGTDAVASSVALLTIFEVHVRKENDLLLPALIAAGTDPAKLLADMEAAFGSRQEAARAG